MIMGTAGEVVKRLRVEAAELAGADLAVALQNSVAGYVDAVLDAAGLFPDAAMDVSDGDNRTLSFVGTEFAVYRAARSTSMVASLDQDQASAQLDNLLEAADRDEVSRWSDRELHRRTSMLFRPLAHVGLFSDPSLVKRLLPPGSEEAHRFAHWVKYDDAGNPSVSLPTPTFEEESGTDPTSWGSFVSTTVAEREFPGSGTLTQVLRVIDDEVEDAE